jgi:lysine 2-monooxygenase
VPPSPSPSASAPASDPPTGGRPPLVTMFGPDFPFAYDHHLRHPAGLGRLPAGRHGTEVAVIGAGISGVVTAYELMRLGLRPVVHEADRIGGRLRSQPFEGAGGVVAELGGMRFPPRARPSTTTSTSSGSRPRPSPTRSRRRRRAR